MIRRKRNRHLLTIAESLELLCEGHKITCADGDRWFPAEVAYAHRLGMSHLSRAAFNHLRAHGYIEFAKVQHPHCAMWEATVKVTGGETK